MKNFRFFLITVFTLAIFAGAFFFVETSYEAQAKFDSTQDRVVDKNLCEEPRETSNDCFDPIEPWNVIADVVCNGKTVSYNLKSALKNSDSVNDLVYSSEKIKSEAYRDLVSLGLSKDAVYEYILPLFFDLTQNFQFVNVEKRDAEVTFDANGFHFVEGVDGVSVDKETLFLSMLKSHGKKIVIELPLSVDKAISVADLQKNTVKKASFTTFFVNSGANRCHNIKLATQSLNGITVGRGDFFSFNTSVGARTEQNGYKQAKVISQGSYADGIGGGVCQVSTTLYNALLLSEIIPKACQHSLVSSYVLAGFDAMVSDGGADLSFVNQTESDIYIAGKVDLQKKSVTFTVYGVPNVFEIKRENEEIRSPFETIETVDKQKYPELVYTDQTKVVENGSDGVKSKSFLCYYQNGKLVARRLIRQNNYKKVDKIVARGYLER